jgi:hypothetical protein
LADGVEAGCLILVAPGGGQELLLIGVDRSWRAGLAVTVEGRREPGRMTTCQQGVPFVVTRIWAAGPT